MDSYSDIGDLLKDARKEMRLSIAEAAARLHIRPRYLELLEAGQFKELPGVSYAKGYLARYAAFLRLDKEEVLRRFERVEDALGRRGFYLPLNFSKEKKPTHVMVWGALAGALALYFCWTMLVMPQHGEAPVVESMEKAQARKITLSADMVERNACLAPQEQLYPACFWLKPQKDFAREVVENEYRSALLQMTLQSSMNVAARASAAKPVAVKAKKAAPPAEENPAAGESEEQEETENENEYPDAGNRRGNP